MLLFSLFIGFVALASSEFLCYGQSIMTRAVGVTLPTTACQRISEFRNWRRAIGVRAVKVEGIDSVYCFRARRDLIDGINAVECVIRAVKVEAIIPVRPLVGVRSPSLSFSLLSRCRPDERTGTSASSSCSSSLLHSTPRRQKQFVPIYIYI